MTKKIGSIVGPYIEGVVHMMIDPGQEDAPGQFTQSRTLVQQDGIAAEIHRDPVIKMPDAFQVALVVPADDQQSIGLPGLDLPDKAGIDDTAEVLETGPFGGVGDEFIFVAIEQGDIPLDVPAKTGVVYRAVAGLLIGVKDLYGNPFFRQPDKPGYMVLNRVGSDNGQFFHCRGSVGEGQRAGCFSRIVPSWR